ncbi:hypothetical protein NDN11_13655 [Acinetobacter sp. C26M]|uniref:hypothetical protein n=1 Tax=unclassified Acinetobacter TaxID=196816 RepID=UPI002036D5E6|nr:MULTISPECIES: hypothetical protein [unclassified Acinetobacter]USA45748.1 hypothetical protein NDN11_13655 [Acinetobacter sp. C26M]USA49247.1 hypothetical protein NDN12_13655 [Acinetobacter sp. C26G]
MSKSYNIPNDYNIYSALSTGKVSDSVINTLFLKRGIILGGKTTRENKADYFSSFMHGFEDFEVISAQHSKVERSEYTSSTNLNTQLEITDVVPIISNIKSSLDLNIGNIQLKNVSQKMSNNVLSLEFDYEKFHPEKQLFAQIENKKSVLTFKKIDGQEQFYLEHPATPEMILWSESVINILKEQDSTLGVDKIDLIGLTKPSLYWQFFDELTSSLDRYTRTNVVEILFKDPNSSNSDDDDEGTYKLISASYRGNQLHMSADFMEKLEEGYRLYRFNWDCVDSNITNSDKYRLSIKVTYDENGKSNFSFISKGFYKNKDGRFSKTLNPIPNSLDLEFNKIVFTKGISLIESLTTQPLRLLAPINEGENSNLESNGSDG